MAVSFEDQANKVIVNPRDVNKVIVEDRQNRVEIGIGGPQGIRGPEGPAGPGTTVEEIIAATSYTHNQIASSSTWIIAHELGFKPNVTVFDSAETQLEAEIIHNDINSLTITFSASMSGKAYLS